MRRIAILIGLLFLPWLERKALPSLGGIQPDLLFLSTVILSLHGRQPWVIVFGLLAGMSRGAFSVDSSSLVPLAYPGAAVVLSGLRSFLFRDHVLTLCLIVWVAHFPVALWWRGLEGGLGPALFDATVFSAYSALFAPVAFFLFRFWSLIRDDTTGLEASHVS